MIIQITQDDIKQGTVDDCDRCPIALATNRVLIAGHHAKVMGSISIYNYVYRRFTCKTPNSVKQFIRSFDDEYVVEPFEFDLEIPEKLLC